MNDENKYPVDDITGEENTVDNEEIIIENNVPYEEDSVNVATTSDTAPEEKTEAKEPVSSRVVRGVFDWVEVFGYALAAMMILFLFVFKYVSVDGSSMSPTFNSNLIDADQTNNEIEDKLIISNLFYTPKTGDIVVVTAENHDKPLIKRVIATSGQTVRIDFDNWKIWIDGELLDESEYLIKGENYFPEVPMVNGNFTTPPFEITIKEGYVFVLGDNRQHSLDSRYDTIGQLRIDDIMGKVVARVYPIDKMKWFG